MLRRRGDEHAARRRFHRALELLEADSFRNRSAALACLADGEGTVMEMVRRMYEHLPERMHGAAARAVLATLIYLRRRGEVDVSGAEAVDSRWTRKA